MLERLAGNDALKAELGTALRGGRLPHAVLLVGDSRRMTHSLLLVGEEGLGAGFAARCLAADYLYPQGGPHAEAVLKKEDTECLVLQGEGASGQIPVKKVREAREAIQRSALSTDAAGRVLFIKDGQVFHQLYRGEDDDTRFYQRISDTLTMLQSGGEPA